MDYDSLRIKVARSAKHPWFLSSKFKDTFLYYLEQLSLKMSVHGILLSGVTQDSVLDPLVFTTYTCPIGIIGQRYGVKYHLYADDTQLYISLNP